MISTDNISTDKVSPIPISSKSEDLGELMARLDAVSVNDRYTNVELIRRGLFTIDFLRDSRMIYQDGNYLGAQVLGHFLNNNQIDSSRYPLGINISALSDFLKVRAGVVMQAIGKLFSNGIPVLDQGQIRIPHIYDVYVATRSAYVVTKSTFTKQDILEGMKLIDPIINQLIRKFKMGKIEDGDREELRSAGYLGLVDATKKYDPSKGARFDAYAIHRIRGSIIDYMRSTHFILHLPRSIYAAKKRIESAADLLEAHLERKPTEEEVAAELGISLDQLRNQRSKIRTGTETFIEDQDDNGEQTQKAIDCETLEQLIAQDRVAIVREVVKQLGPRLQALIQMHYYQSLNFKQIGTDFGVTESRACQLHAIALSKLKIKLQRRTSEEVLQALSLN